MGFFDDLLGAGEDLLTSTFDPETGWLGRPVSGALRTGAGYLSQMDPDFQSKKITDNLLFALTRSPEAYARTLYNDKKAAERERVLNETLGKDFGTKMIEEPVQQVAKEMTGAEGTLPELTRAAFAPNSLPGDIPKDIRETTMTPQGPIETTREPTSEDVKTMMGASKFLGEAAESGGGLLKQAPELMLLPQAPALAGIFLPGAAESLGTNIATGQYGKAAIDALFATGLGHNLYGMGKGVYREGARPNTSEAKQSERVTEPSLETAAPIERPEVSNIQDLVSTPHEQQARDAFSKYVDDIKGEVARVTGQEHIADAKVEYVPELGSAKYDPETNTVLVDPTLLFREPASRLAETAFHELSHGGEFTRHNFGNIEYTGEMVPGPEGRPIAEAVNKIELGKLPPEEGLPTPDTYEIDAGELGLTPRQLNEAGNYVVTRPELHEHYTPYMEERASSFAPNETDFISAFNAAKNNPATVDRAKQFESEIAGIQRGAREVELAKIGEKPAKSYEENLADIQAGRALPVDETGAPKSIDIEREALTRYAREQDAIVRSAGEKFQSAKTDAERSLASKEFQKAKAERDRIQTRITQLGGEKVVSEPVKEIAKTEPVSTKAKSEEVIETPPSERVVSAPANNLRRLLEGMNLTRFNLEKLPDTLKAAGLDVPAELKAQLPELIKELKDRGWVNEKIGGTYTLLTAPPKQLKGVSGGKIADVTNLKGSLEESLKALGAEPVKEPVKAPTPTSTIRPGQFHFDETGRKWEVRRVEGDQVTLTSGRGGGERTQILSKDDILARRGIMPERARETGLPEEPPKIPEEEEIDLSSLEEGGGKVEPPNLADKMKEKLTPDELQAIAKLFGTEKKRKGTKETPQEVLDAQKAALRGLVEKETKGGENVPIEEVETGPKQNFDVTLSDGTTHKVRASSAEEAQAKAEEVLTQYQSTKKVDKVEPSLSTLEKAAKYEIEPVKEATENISENVSETKASMKEQAKKTIEQLRYQEQLRRAQFQEMKKKRQLEEKTKKGATEKTGFLENPAVKVLNAIKSITFGGDVGHLLRQGKQMNADLLFSKHAKKVLDQVPVLFKLGKGGMKELENLNTKLYSDPDIRMMVDDFGMDMPGMGKGLKEEAFHGAGFAEKLPIIGKHYVERSEAVYTGGLNYLRSATAKKWVDSLKKEGFTPENAPEKYHAIARAVNIISQRGEFSPAYQKLFSDASAIFGAPRAKAARIQNAFELFRGGTSGRVVRTTAAKTLAFNAGLYGLLAATVGAKFIDDPEASDFCKIRINDKITVDPWMGLGVTARTVAKLVTDKGKSPYTGKGYPVNAEDALKGEFAGGIAPGIKLMYEAYKGKDLRGFEIYRLESLLNVAPLTAKSIQELFKEGDIDEAIELSLLQFMGEGVDVFNYEEARAKQARLKAERGLSTGKHGRKVKRTYAFE